MHNVKKSLIFVGAMFVGSGSAMAATTTVETFSFDATLISGSLLCGRIVGSQEHCPGLFGLISVDSRDDLMVGKSLGGTYAGQITIGYDGTKATEATCQLGGADCLFEEYFLPSAPVGPISTLIFTTPSSVGSAFRFSGTTGSYFFDTDYIFSSDGFHFYDSVKFDLSDVSYTVSEVPLPSSIGFLAVALGGFAAFRRRKASDAG